MPYFQVLEVNQGKEQLAQNPVTNSNAKHIDVRHHFLRELIHQGDILGTYAQSINTRTF